jgi:cytochrome c-type biogenesis protein CcmH
MSETTTARTGTARRRTWSRVSLIGVVIVIAVSLVIGSGIGRSAPPTAAARASALDRIIRCPVCDDISVADSQASQAVAIRRNISTMVDQGKSDAQIEQALVDRWGPSILLSPPKSGWTALVWVLPLVAVVVALAGLGVFFWRRQATLRSLRDVAPGDRE